VAWATALAEVIRDDRAETVGGTLHARPVVAARWTADSRRDDEL